MIIWVIKIFFGIVLLCILDTSQSLLLLLRPYCFCSLSCPSFHDIFLWYLQFYWRDLYSFPLYIFSLFLCINHLRRPSYLSLIFSGTLFLFVCFCYIFPFLSCFLLLFISQLFVKPPQMTTLPSCIYFSLGWC